MDRYLCDRIASYFADSDSDFHRKIHRKLIHCCDRLRFYKDTTEPEGARFPYKLLRANFCHQRVCLICQSRLANRWRNRLGRGIPKVELACERHRWIFGTFTMRNMPITNLRQSINHLLSSWSRFTEYGRYNSRKPRFKPFPAVGWIRSLEVSRGVDGSAHPHVHSLLFMPPAYFRNGYEWSHDDWVDAWGRALQVDYQPILRVVDVEKGSQKVGEIAKYITKPSDLSFDPAWTREYSHQVHNCQMRAIGGQAFFGNPDLAAPKAGEDLIIRKNYYADTDEQASFRWNPTREAYDLID